MTRSLRSRLLWGLIPLQAALLALLLLLVIGTLWQAGFLLAPRDEDHVIDIVQRAVARDGSGRLVLQPTAELQRIRSEIPDLWFLVRDSQGGSLSEGAVPPDMTQIGAALDHISQARLGWQLFDDPRKAPVRLKRVDTAAGNVQILTATQGELSGRKALLATILVFLGLALPGFLLMTLATFIATPIVVRRALAGLSLVADQARQIDTHQRGVRLALTHVPAEITQLVATINDALSRLDEGYARHQRFVADAAHELRTPIAILNTRLEALPPSSERARLLEDVARLATLADQLLDIQRLEQNRNSFALVDLVALAQRAAADLAPLAIAAGYELAFNAEADRIECCGDANALERAVINLVQNAIQHGGRQGTISICVTPPATIEVSDQGTGIPPEHRALVFEPFYRLHPLNRGAGLGLNLVREIAHLHGGSITVFDAPSKGACFRLSLRPIQAAR
ncbi:HAMP domain-containing sensor histidine kinase [Bradyrhizobium sp. ARR65]|uniref:sensor histidine kinase n=1 Tax=Bradyrhizobium sp. ARR65 TaxID=1040989 RepID=UPI000466ED4B|nr:HAMP domain-containing sensor histidine kinase [Bradyrhizobium sp. ARR65]